MEDLRTQETLDALADLFLTGTTPPARKPPGAAFAGGPMRTPPRKAGDDAPALETRVVAGPGVLDAMGAMSTAHAQAAHDHANSNTPTSSNPAASFIDELDGPGSISIGARRTSAQHHEEQDEYAPQPASLRIHREDDAADTDVIDPPRPAHIEAVFLGNLPGFGGPWLTQYAHHLAQHRGPTAILHLAGEQADIELVTAKQQTIRPGIDEPLPAGTDAAGLIARLRQMATDRALPVVNWLIHLPSPTDPVQLARAAGIAHWTLLCGSDGMAIAAATRMLGTLLDQTKGNDDPVAQEAAQARLIGVMIMGSDDAKAREAIDQFNAAASGFLARPIELVGSRRQMTPVHMRPLGGAQGGEVWPAIKGYLRTLAQEDERRDEEATVGAGINSAVAAGAGINSAVAAKPQAARKSINESESAMYGTSSAVMEPPSEVDQLTGYQPSASRQSAPSAAAAAAMASPRVTPAMAPAVEPASSSSPRSPRIAQTPPAAPAPSSINEPDLTALLTGSIAGSIALDARYPKQKDTQFVLDQHGQLHLLRRQYGTDLRAALVDLIEARDWVREHMELIVLTQRQCRFDTASEPILHLFTADAKNAVSMVNKLGPFVKLHLLQEVRIGNAKTWVCTELN